MIVVMSQSCQQEPRHVSSSPVMSAGAPSYTRSEAMPKNSESISIALDEPCFINYQFQLLIKRIIIEICVVCHLE